MTSTIESRDSDMQTAVDTITAEHRTLGRVLELVQRLLDSISKKQSAADFELLSAAFYYIDDFPRRCHHPKEDQYLFAAVRRHAPHHNAAVNRLQEEHVLDAQMLHGLHSALVCYQGGARDGLDRLRSQLDVYCAMLREHMLKEEKLLACIGTDLPATEWRSIASAFAADDDPLFGKATRREFDRLRERIINRLPSKLRSSRDRGSSS